MAGECTRAALCHLFMSRWFRVRFERRLAAASGLTLTEVGSNADGQVPVESCRLRSAPSLGVPRVSGVAAEVALFGRERAPPEGGGVRHSGVGNARVVSAVRPVRPVGDGEQQPAHAVVGWLGAGGACLLCLSGLCGGGTRRRVGAPRTENYLELRAAEGAAIR
jgi:hypothetical protein